MKPTDFRSKPCFPIQLVLIVLVHALLAACSAPENPADRESVLRDRMDPELLEKRQKLLEKKPLQGVPVAEPVVKGEVPTEVIDSVKQALEILTGSPRATFEVVRSEQTIWPDGALGCPHPGMFYTQATVPGYHVVLKHKGRQYDYRAGGSGFLMLCLEPNG